MLKPKKFDLVHQTVSPCERVGSGDETITRLDSEKGLIQNFKLREGENSDPSGRP